MTEEWKAIAPDQGRAIHWIGGKLTSLSTAADAAFTPVLGRPARLSAGPGDALR